VSGSAVFVSSLSLLIRAYNRARCQAEILLSALRKKAEPALGTTVSVTHGTFAKMVQSAGSAVNLMH
jgi:hypothetical protein